MEGATLPANSPAQKERPMKKEDTKKVPVGVTLTISVETVGGGEG